MSQKLEEEGVNSDVYKKAIDSIMGPPKVDPEQIK